jgi:predicted GNAT family acetyltransferase
MAWTLTEDLDEFAAAAGDFLLSRPVTNTVQLTALATLRARGVAAYGGAALFGWWSSAGRVDGVFMVTPPYPALLTPLPDQPARLVAAALATALAARDMSLAGVNAEQDTAAAFAGAWGELTGAAAEVHRRSRLFRLDQIVPPDPQPAGEARVATASDRELLELWSDAFGREVDDLGHRGQVVDDRLSYGGVTLWEVGGDPVAMAGVTRTVAGVTRVGPVYTPPGQRKRGYGGTATVAVSQAALAAGAQHVVLFTDLANPTSNALYQRLGYRPLNDSVVLRFKRVIRRS